MPAKQDPAVSPSSASDPPTAFIQSEQRFYELIESLPMVAVQGYDKKRQVIYWNEASRRLYGYTREEAQGRLLEDLIIPERKAETASLAAFRDWLVEAAAGYRCEAGLAPGAVQAGESQGM